MEIGAVVGALIFFFIIVPTMFPKTYQRAVEWAGRLDPDHKDKPSYDHELTNLHAAKSDGKKQA